MAETSLTINGDSNNKIGIDPTQIRGEGGPDYPRLIMPLQLSLRPISNYTSQNKPFVVWDIKSKLFMENNPQKISDALSSISNFRIFNSYTSQYDLEFPIDAYRVKKIEDIRKGADLKLRLDLYFVVGIYEPLIVQNDKNQQVTKHFIAESETSFVQMLDIMVPQSSWIKILPSFGHTDYFLVEIPKSVKIIKDAWSYLEKAEIAFMRWDTQGVFTNCREVGSILENVLKEKIGSDDLMYSQRWSRFYKGFNHWASLDLHRADIKVEAKKADAEHIVFVTKSLIHYAEELLREKE